MLLRDYVTKHVCVCAEVRSFPTHTGDLTSWGNVQVGWCGGQVPGAACPWQLMPFLPLRSCILLSHQSGAGGGTPTRGSLAPRCSPGDQGGSHHHTGAWSPLWDEGYRMGIPGDLEEEGLHPCSLNWGPLPRPCHLSQNGQILGVLCLRLSWDCPWLQHH